jgi:hypothetical protein
VFLSAGLHETPFHFDFQESITIQLAGCKRWLLTPSHFRNPTHNASPFIFDRDLFFDQLKIHGSDLHVPPAEELMRKSRGVTLRFFSVFFFVALIFKSLAKSGLCSLRSGGNVASSGSSCGCAQLALSFHLLVLSVSATGRPGFGRSAHQPVAGAGVARASWRSPRFGRPGDGAGKDPICVGQIESGAHFASVCAR